MLENMPFDILSMTAEYLSLQDFMSLVSTSRVIWNLKMIYSGKKYLLLKEILFNLTLRYRSSNSLERFPVLGKTILNIIRKSPTVVLSGNFTKTKDILPPGSSALHHLTFCGFYEAVKVILEKGINPNVTNTLGQTPLFICRNYQVCKLLINHGANLNFKDSLGRTPIFLQPQVELVKLMVREGADVKIKTQFGYSILHYLQSVSVAEYYVEMGLDMNTTSDDGSTPLHTTQDPDIANFLIKNGVDVNARNLDNETALFGSEYNTAQVLLNNGALVNVQDLDGNTPLFDFERSNTRETLQLLIDNGGDVNVVRQDGRSAIHYASLELVETLVNNGADINARDNAGLTPLFTCFERYDFEMEEEEWNGFQELVFKLIALGADLNAVDYQGRGLLHHAPTEPIAQLFLDLGCDVNAKDNLGRVPLHCTSDINVAKCLIANGARFDIVDVNMEFVWTNSFAIKAWIEIKEKFYFEAL